MKGKGILKIKIEQETNSVKNIPISDRPTLIESALVSPQDFAKSGWDFLKLEITDSGCGINAAKFCANFVFPVPLIPLRITNPFVCNAV